MKYLGIDWGQKRIGLSTGDSEAKIAIPFGVASNPSEILEIIKKEEISAVVLGDPREMCGGESRLAGEFNYFKKYLEEKSGLLVELVDERLTSKEADSLPGGKKLKASRDAVAAMLILQAYFDKT